jgi:hypothetical protein
MYLSSIYLRSIYLCFFVFSFSFQSVANNRGGDGAIRNLSDTSSSFHFVLQSLSPSLLLVRLLHPSLFVYSYLHPYYILSDTSYIHIHLLTYISHIHFSHRQSSLLACHRCTRVDVAACIATCSVGSQ